MGSGTHQDAIMSVRQNQASTGEPILKRTRKAQSQGECSIRVNITSVGRDILGIEPGDDLDVEVYQDHIRVAPEE